jgi:formamidopyrimidine-DNA glycosylase
MPELPEVETIKEELKRKIVGLELTGVEVRAPKLFQWDCLSQKDLIGAKIKNIWRRAKVIVFELSGGKSLITHLKLTGQLIYQDKKTRIAGGHPIPPLNFPVPNKTTHIIFSFTNGGRLYFNDLRKFGWVKFLPTSRVATLKEMAEFGPEPFDPSFTLGVFKERLGKHQREQIKPLLMDQKFIAGIGNIYSDEALWLAKIHPLRRVSTLTDGKISALYEAIRESLEKAIKLGGASRHAFARTAGEAGLYLSYANAYHMTGKPCKRCKTPIKRIKIGGRSAHFCPKCQKLT